jgi:hypothetical protein
MYPIIFTYLSWYLCVGFITAFIIDQSIRVTKQTDPYTAKEIAVSIILWPLMVIVFIYGVIKGFFNNESN